MWLQPEVSQLGVFGIVVMLFSFYARIRKVIDGHAEPQFLARGLYHSRQLQHRKLLSELVEYSEFAALRRMQACQFNAAHRITNIKEAACLAAFAVNRNRMPDSRLDAETVQGRAKHLIVIKTVDQRWMQGNFVRNSAIDHALVQVCGAHAPDLAAEGDVMAVM